MKLAVIYRTIICRGRLGTRQIPAAGVLEDDAMGNDDFAVRQNAAPCEWESDLIQLGSHSKNRTIAFCNHWGDFISFGHPQKESKKSANPD